MTEQHTIVVYGYSDDLIETEGAVRLEGGGLDNAKTPIVIDGTPVATIEYGDKGIWFFTPDSEAMAQLGLTWEQIQPYGEDVPKRSVEAMGVTVEYAPGYSEFLAIRGDFRVVEVGGDRGEIA